MEKLTIEELSVLNDNYNRIKDGKDAKELKLLSRQLLLEGIKDKFWYTDHRGRSAPTDTMKVHIDYWIHKGYVPVSVSVYDRIRYTVLMNLR